MVALAEKFGKSLSPHLGGDVRMVTMEHTGAFVHPNALCDSESVGIGTRVWAFAHIMAGAEIGDDCNICDGAYVEGDVRIGDRVTVKNQVMIFDGVSIADDVFLGPGVTFTNDLRPRAFIKRSGNELLRTVVQRGATLGARVTVVCGVTIGEYAFAGAGAVVVGDIPAHALVVGSPARQVGWVCRCAQRLRADLVCPACGSRFFESDGRLLGLERGVAAIPDSLHVTGGIGTVHVDGTDVHLVDEPQAIELIIAAAEEPRQRPLAVASINLDHVHHFGVRATGLRFGSVGSQEWLNLIDGAPVARQVKRVTGVRYPRLAGSDLIFPILEEAARRGQSVGVIGGLPEVKPLFADKVHNQWPKLRVVGHWTPSREELGSPKAMEELAAEIRDVAPSILLVCLGKPRQERWIESYGASSGARVLLAFGAVVDFLAGRVARAPEWVSSAGLEWSWRLLHEPRRLAPRYLIQGPPAYLRVRRSRALGTKAGQLA